MPTQRLTPHQITDVALDLIDDAGPDALTMRALADRLGVGTMTLYGYFRSRDALLDAVVDAVTTPPDTGPSDAPEAALTSLFGEFYRVLVRHPGLHRVRARRPFLSPGVLRLTDRAVGVLLAAGLSEPAAVRAYRSLYLYTLGCATYAAQSPDETRRALAALPAGDLPHVHRVRSAMIDAAGAPDEFEHGLAILLPPLLADRTGAPSAGQER